VGRKRGRTPGGAGGGPPPKEVKSRTPKTPKDPKLHLAKSPKAAKTPKEKVVRPPTIKKHVSLMHLDPLRVGAGGVALICADCAPCELRPLSFFVAWSGVLTLAWEGFPPAIAAVKKKIARKFPMLPDEKPGSAWAKTSLGCLKEGKRLTPEQLRVLANVCEEYREALTPAAAPGDPAGSARAAAAAKGAVAAVDAPAGNLVSMDDDEAAADAMLMGAGEDDDDDDRRGGGGGGMGGGGSGGMSGGGGDDSEPEGGDMAMTVASDDSPAAAKWTPGCVSVEALSVVLFQCRSLERILSEQVIALHGEASHGAPLQPERAAVNSVLAAFASVDDYWVKAGGDGSRELHYRETKMGATLVARVGGRLPDAVGAFKRAVEAALPGMYAWFEDASLHVTVRGLVEPS
jgi:hypothetical protein